MNINILFDKLNLILNKRIIYNMTDWLIYYLGVLSAGFGLMHFSDSSKEVFYFTRPMVDEIVQLGFQDEKELQFQFLMKNELIIENGMRTAGYAETDDVLELNREIKSKVL